MNEDIKILREALAKYAQSVELPKGVNLLYVPLPIYTKAIEDYRAACDPDRIRRILDDAERWAALVLMVDEDQVRPVTEHSESYGLTSDQLKAVIDHHLLNAKS